VHFLYPPFGFKVCVKMNCFKKMSLARRIALSEAVKNWDRDEKIGDVFVASFSKAVVLEIYSEFINNFTAAMECAKQESKRKSALADFLKVKQVKQSLGVSLPV